MLRPLFHVVSFALSPRGDKWDRNGKTNGTWRSLSALWSIRSQLRGMNGMHPPSKMCGYKEVVSSWVRIIIYECEGAQYTVLFPARPLSQSLENCLFQKQSITTSCSTKDKFNRMMFLGDRDFYFMLFFL